MAFCIFKNKYNENLSRATQRIVFLFRDLTSSQSVSQSNDYVLALNVVKLILDCLKCIPIHTSMYKMWGMWGDSLQSHIGRDSEAPHIPYKRVEFPHSF